MTDQQNKNRLAEIKLNLIGGLGKLFIDILFLTIRIERDGYSRVRSVISSRKFIIAFWHSRLLLISYLYKGWNGVAIVSQSKDGEIIARIMEKQGHEPVRGSTTRGGIRALAKQIRRLEENVRPGAVIPDGPQGPRFKAQPGVIFLAKKTGYPIVPVSYSAKKIKIFNSWDRFVLPYPFTRCLAVYGEPIQVPKDVDSDGVNMYRLRLEQELCRITFEADQQYGHTIV